MKAGEYELRNLGLRALSANICDICGSATTFQNIRRPSISVSLANIGGPIEHN